MSRNIRAHRKVLAVAALAACGLASAVLAPYGVRAKPPVTLAQANPAPVAPAPASSAPAPATPSATPAPPASPPPASKPASAPASPPAPTTPQAAPANAAEAEPAGDPNTATVIIATMPPATAMVTWGRKKLGKITPGKPLVVVRPRDSGPLDIMVRAEGFLAVQTRAHTFSDNRVVVKLTPPENASELLGYRAPVEPVESAEQAAAMNALAPLDGEAQPASTFQVVPTQPSPMLPAPQPAPVVPPAPLAPPAPAPTPAQ